MSKITDFIDGVIRELEYEKKIQQYLGEIKCIPPEEINSFTRIQHLLEFRGGEANLLAGLAKGKQAK